MRFITPYIKLALSCLACIFHMKLTVKHSCWTPTFLHDIYLFKYSGHIDICDMCCDYAVARTLMLVISGCL